MNPSDDELGRAMRRLESDPADVPDLFVRVQTGVRRRRQRRARWTAGSGAVAVVVAVALTIAFTRGSNAGPATGVSPAAGADSSAAPSVVAQSPQAAASGLSSPGPMGRAAATPRSLVGTCLADWLPCSTPPASLPMPISSGACAPGVSVVVVGGTDDHVLLTVKPGDANALALAVGEGVSFSALGNCAADVFFAPVSGDVFGAIGPNQPFHVGDAGYDLTATQPGTELLDVRLPTCDGATDALCPDTQARITVTVSPKVIEADAPHGAAPSPLPEDSSGCPMLPAQDLAGDISGVAGEEAMAVQAAVDAVPSRYPAALLAQGFEVTNVYGAQAKTGYGVVADAICGTALGDQSYVVELRFPAAGDAVSAGGGQLFLAQFASSNTTDGGFQVWYQYH